MYQRLRKTRLAEWGPFDKLPLSEVIRGLNEQIRRADPERENITFIISPNAAPGAVDPAGLPVQTTDIRDATVRLESMLRDVTVEQALNNLIQQIIDGAQSQW